MALKNTVKTIQELLANITTDLQKAENGNKAASQRVRTGTIKLEKQAKVYRKESIADEKKNKGKRPVKSAGDAKKAGTKAPAKAAAGKKVAAKPAAKKPVAKASVKPSQLSAKRPTAKIPAKKSKLKSWLF